MPVKTYFTVDINEWHSLKKYDHYPSEEEIEKEIIFRFPLGYIFDQFANEKIFPVAQVNKYFTLSQKEDI